MFIIPLAVRFLPARAGVRHLQLAVLNVQPLVELEPFLDGIGIAEAVIPDLELSAATAVLLFMAWVMILILAVVAVWAATAGGHSTGVHLGVRWRQWRLAR
jgi:hypothetical protein